jgi:hypothetical protein
VQWILVVLALSMMFGVFFLVFNIIAVLDILGLLQGVSWTQSETKMGC